MIMDESEELFCFNHLNHCNVSSRGTITECIIKMNHIYLIILFYSFFVSYHPNLMESEQLQLRILFNSNESLGFMSDIIGRTIIICRISIELPFYYSIIL